MKSPLCRPSTPECKLAPQDGQYHSTEEPWFPSSSGYSLSLASQLGVALCAHFPAFCLTSSCADLVHAVTVSEFIRESALLCVESSVSLKPCTTSGSSIHTDSRNLIPLFTPSFPLSDNLKPLYFIFCLLSQRSLTQRHLCSGESKVRMFCDSQLCRYTVGCFTWLHNKYVSYLFNVLTVCVLCMCTCVHMYKPHAHGGLRKILSVLNYHTSSCFLETRSSTGIRLASPRDCLLSLPSAPILYSAGVTEVTMTGFWVDTGDSNAPLMFVQQILLTPDPSVSSGIWIH